MAVTNLPNAMDLCPQQISPEGVPTVAEAHFREQSKKYVSYFPGKALSDFGGLWFIDTPEHGGIYVASDRKLYSTNFADESLVYLLDVDEDGQRMGHSEVRFGHTDKPYFKDKPFVGITATDNEYLKQGLGMRRLFAMNAIAKLLFSLPLHCDTNITPNARSLWARLEQSGIATSYQEGVNERFRFNA